MSLLDKLNKLIVGSKLDDLKKVQQSLNRLKNITTSTDVVTFSELIRTIYKDRHPNQLQNEDIYTSMSKILKEFGLEITDVKIENDRIARYQEYDAIVRKIPYMKRALKVITQNILNPEDYTKRAIQIFKEDSLRQNNHDDLIIDELLEYIKTYDIEEYIYDIVYNTLKFGDYFVEILILPEVLRKYKLLSESSNFQIEETVKLELDDKNIELNVNFQFENTQYLLENKSKITNDLKDLKLDRDDIYLNFLSPDQVVRLGDRFCLGYVVFKNMEKSKSLSGVNSTVEKLVNQDGVQTLAKKFITQIQQKNKYYQNLIKTETDLKYVIAKFLATYINLGQSPDNITLSTRFVPPELMQHFTTDKTEFRPYGTSIFFGAEFLAKVVVAIQSSIMIQRLTRSVEKRVIRVDIGASRDSRRYLMEVKRQFTRRRYTVDSIGTVDEIPSNLTTFEDIYLPVKNGRTPVEFDTLPPVGDLSTRVDDLKQLRDSLVATTDVPPPYLGIEENTESKAQLTQENVVFAASIINYQKAISQCLTELLQKVLVLLIDNPQKLEDYKKFVVTFDPPTSILIEHKSDYINSVSGIIETLKNLGIPEKYLIDKYLPYLKEWKVESAKIEEDLEKVYKGKEGEEGGEEFGGGGFGGGEFGGGTPGSGETGGSF